MYTDSIKMLIRAGTTHCTDPYGHIEHTAAYCLCGPYFWINFPCRAETEEALRADMAKGLRIPLGWQGDEYGAEFGRRKGEGLREKKGETWEGCVCILVCVQCQNWSCSRQGPWLLSENGAFPRGKMGAWQTGICVCSTLSSLIRDLASWLGGLPRRNRASGTPHSEPLSWKAKIGNTFLKPEAQLEWSELGVRTQCEFQ